jgi:ADP-ribose pyrophosphatase YjhB (NUDIX family)
MSYSKFNIRVYGILLNDNREVLVSEEIIRGQKVIKFPGGGMEYGEGIKDALIREWREELETDIQVQEHYYTTDFFQPSAYDDSQVISIYYKVTMMDNRLQFPYTNGNELFYFVAINNTIQDMITLPIDKKVAAMLTGV